MGEADVSGKWLLPGGILHLMPKYKIIVNPIAGRGAGGEAIPQIERMLNVYSLDFDLVRTERPWHAAEIAREAAITGYDVVVAVGDASYSIEDRSGVLGNERIFVMPLAEAAGVFPDLVRDHVRGHALPADWDKFVALNWVFWNFGLFIHQDCSHHPTLL